MRRGGEIGKTHGIAGKPASRLGEMADIGEMIAQVLVPRPHRLHVGRGAVRSEAPEHLLLHEIGGHLLMELAVEPVDQAPYLGPRRFVARKWLEQAAVPLVP